MVTIVGNGRSVSGSRKLNVGATIKKPSYKAISTSVDFVSGETNIDGSIITINFSDILVGSHPLPSSFNILYDGITPIVPTSATFRGSQVSLLIPTPATNLTVITASFIDEPDNNIGAFTAQPITNNVV